MLLILAAISLLGHAAIFVAIINRVHSTALPRWILKCIDLVWYSCALGIPIAVATSYLRQTVSPSDPALSMLAYCYGLVCVAAAITAVAHRIAFIVGFGNPPQLISNHTEVFSLTQELGHRPTNDPATTLLSYLPGNEILSLSVHDKKLDLPRLDRRLDGLTITHLSDLHLTGQLAKSFYEEVVRRANDFQSDIIVLAGDIVEKRRCLPWVGEILSQLSAPHGVFYVLGNHELRIKDDALVRQTLDAAGLQGLGGRWISISHNGAPITMAGTEVPWFPPAPDMDSCADEVDGQRSLRVLLSHSPDQLGFAVKCDFDLMLAGHTHGGQVRLPLIGPILSPSFFGIRHAAGTFYQHPTLLHVSRGLAGTRPLRFRCPPELTRLVLRRQD